jgi:hypothetical protein
VAMMMMVRTLSAFVNASVLGVAIGSTRHSSTTTTTKMHAKDASFGRGNKFLTVVPIFI